VSAAQELRRRLAGVRSGVVVVALLLLLVWAATLLADWLHPADQTCEELAYSVRYGTSQEERGLAGHEWLTECDPARTVTR
jgi:hypothetical protein